ncbi:MAG: cobyrinate a,c-diamide synthase, partial [Porphyromonadaceae bacterium]|nr:cobyrinate a,c-diamide synthase [Porphyromonadaceae bacterium]
MTSTSIPQLLVAAGSSGSGKTTFTLGLLRALKRRGLAVQSFKCGPDYIDPKFHQLSSGRPSINLDLFMMSPEHVRAVYARHTQEADAVVLEGVMGLYDGYVRMHGSSAEVAKTVGIPTVLLVDARSSAYSVGALLYGFKHFRQDTEVVGVVFNRVASENHYRFLREAAEDAGVIPLGYIPKTKLLEVPSRHLGLSLRELQELDALPEDVAALIEKHVDVDRLLEACMRPRPAVPTEEAVPMSAPGRKIAVARDEAFNFIYEENIRALAAQGEVSFFSPLKDEALPECDLLYLPGGYPEFY